LPTTHRVLDEDSVRTTNNYRHRGTCKSGGCVERFW